MRSMSKCRQRYDWAGGLRLCLEVLESRQLMTVSSASALFAKPMYEEVTSVSSDGTVSPMATNGPSGYTPAQIRHAYGIDQISFNGGAIVGDGAGQTIAIVDAYDDPTIVNDLHQFDLAFGLADPLLVKVNQSGGSTMPQADSGWAGEIALDVEWAHAIAPKAKILLVEASDASYTNLMAAVNYARNYPGVASVSMSWGGDEFSGETSLDNTFSTPAGHSGVVFVASSGDSGAPAQYPAASPNVLSVGGTSLRLNSSSVISSETAWTGSTGGVSSFETQPSYQKGTVTQTATRRAVPDVSYDSDPNTGFPVYNSYGTSAPWGQYGGTSDAAPQWAALVAIADEGRALAGLPALTSLQTLSSLYQLPASYFNDVTSGTSLGSPRVTAGAGYDLVTGRGSPNANLVVSALVGSSSTSTPTASATHLAVSAPTSVNAGATFSITVSALSSANATVGSYRGTVHFTSSDAAAGLPANYTFTAADNGVHTFTGLVLSTAGSRSVVITDTANSSITGSAIISAIAQTTTNPSGTSSVIESFENGLGNYRFIGSTQATVAASTAAAHNGSVGLVDSNGSDWIFRTDSAAQVKRGDTVSVWVNFSGSADGRAYFGFGSSTGGTLSLVAAPNTNQLLLQTNAGYANYTNLAATTQTWQANHWYRLEVSWSTSGAILGKVYDSNGTTLLNAISGASPVVSGGIAFRAIGSSKLWDTVTLTPAVNTFAGGRSLDAASSASTADGGAQILWSTTPATTTSQQPASVPSTSASQPTVVSTPGGASQPRLTNTFLMASAASTLRSAAAAITAHVAAGEELLDEWALEVLAEEFVRVARG